MSADRIHHIVSSIEHLAYYANCAYFNDDGVEFRMHARGNLKEEPLTYRNLQIHIPFFQRGLRAITSNTHIHLGVLNGNTLLLAFRGTDFPLHIDNFKKTARWLGFAGNAITDVSFGWTKFDWPNADLPNVLVHKGFLLAFNNIVQDDKWLEYIDQLRRDISGQDFEKIEICGHSLGGALATLCALWCNIRWPNMDITCVTLGSPRVGNQNFVEEFNKPKIRCYRFMLDYDPIPNLPNRYTEAVKLPIPPTDPGERRYKHVGTPIWLRRQDGTPGARLGENSPSVASEERARNLDRIMKTKFFFGGFVASGWTGGRELIGNIGDHSPMQYATTVYRIKALRQEARRRTGGEAAVTSKNSPGLMLVNTVEDLEG